MQEQILWLLKDLVRIPSVTSDAKQLYIIIDYVKELFDSYEWVHIFECVHNDKPSLIIQNFEWKFADIVLSGHLDVVPAQSQDLFEPLEKDGKLYGRWCGDMKDGCSIIITLMKQLLEQWYTDKRVSLWLTTDEEIWWVDGVWALVQDGWWGKIALIPDAWDYTYITYASKGIISLNLEVTWHAAHSSRPWMWDNALEKVYALYQELKHQLEHEDILYATDDHRSTSVQLTKCHGGIASNVLPETAYATINIRFTEEWSQETIFQLIEATCEIYNATITSRESWPLMYTDPENTYLTQFSGFVEQITWAKPSLDKEHGTTDGRYFPPETTVLLYQPTDNNIHTAGEYTMVDQLEDVYNIYTLFVHNVVL